MATKKKKKGVLVTIPEEVLEFIDDQIEKGIYANRSHGVTFAVKRVMEVS